MTITTERTLVRYTATEGVAVIELTNPPANTYSYDMMHQLDEAILRARFDDDVHVIVIRGEGDKFFCAGAGGPRPVSPFARPGRAACSGFAPRSAGRSRPTAARCCIRAADS